jgi:hypothetical protein
MLRRFNSAKRLREFMFGFYEPSLGLVSFSGATSSPALRNPSSIQSHASTHRLAYAKTQL